MFFKARLKAVEKKVCPPKPRRELKLKYVFSDEFVPRTEKGKALIDPGEHENDVLIVEVVKTPRPRVHPPDDLVGVDLVQAIPDDGQGETTAKLEAEIKKLERRKRELQKRAKP